MGWIVGVCIYGRGVWWVCVGGISFIMVILHVGSLGILQE